MKRLILLNILLLTGVQLIPQNIPADIPILVREGKEISQEVIRATREFRNRLLSDPYRPAFHFCIPEGNGRPGDPNGTFFKNGSYHLMFLYNRTGDGFSWGHVSSKDLLHWRFHPDAIFPGDGDDGCFSGGVFVDDDGSAVLSYWMLWGARGIGLAISKDPDFSIWEKSKTNPVINKSVVEVFANDKQAIARMIYPKLGGHGISLFSEGGTTEVKSVKAWELSPSNPY